eukprot:TRINITY_DN3783_c0_g1_i1.p1 TRINITY_DN3783_c0_g1~~TRINITY_DN3783_c0_g1_i1.p1  ORF type:complete len:155 (+),score=43.67 TRINITY_DN3783_c0_g1_i1:19-483(+)
MTAEPKGSSTSSNDAGASLTSFKQSQLIRKKDFVKIKNRPCKVVFVHSFKNGKHGHAVIRLDGIDIFTNKKLTCHFPSGTPVETIPVKRSIYDVLEVDGDYVTILCDDGSTRDIKADHEILSALEKGIANDNIMTITMVSALGTDLVIDAKAAE